MGQRLSSDHSLEQCQNRQEGGCLGTTEARTHYCKCWTVLLQPGTALHQGQHGNLCTHAPLWKGDLYLAELLLFARAPRAEKSPVSRWAHMPRTGVHPWKAHLAESDFLSAISKYFKAVQVASDSLYIWRAYFWVLLSYKQCWY